MGQFTKKKVNNIDEWATWWWANEKMKKQGPRKGQGKTPS
jgi:hypothetical protein